GVCAQTSSDAARLTNLGAPHVEVCGNVKFDVTPAESMLKLGVTLRQRLGADRPVLLIASTREGEEELVLDALSRMSIDKLVTLIVPRHPQRFDEIAALIQKRGFKLQRRSSNDVIDAATQVVLGDSMGEMFAYYTAC